MTTLILWAMVIGALNCSVQAVCVSPAVALPQRG